MRKKIVLIKRNNIPPPEAVAMIKIIEDLRSEIDSCSNQTKPQFLVDDDDEYQEQLELGWHLSELRDELTKVEKDLFTKYQIKVD
jgi:hypothetical protein